MKQTGNGKVWLLLLFLTAFPILYSLCLPQGLLTGQMEPNRYPAFPQHFALLWLSQACLGGALLLVSPLPKQIQGYLCWDMPLGVWQERHVPLIEDAEAYVAGAVSFWLD